MSAECPVLIRWVGRQVGWLVGWLVLMLLLLLVDVLTNYPPLDSTACGIYPPHLLPSRNAEECLQHRLHLRNLLVNTRGRRAVHPSSNAVSDSANYLSLPGAICRLLLLH